MISIAVLLTCFNRREQTLSCLRTLYAVQEEFICAHTPEEQVSLVVYLTDDGCTDGTSDAIKNEFRNHNINILQGNGNLFWAGGMRVAWNAALRSNVSWDYFLLLNDDTDLLPNFFDELFQTRKYCLNHFGKEGIISGVTAAKSDSDKVTYGGDVWIDRWSARSKRVIPEGTPISVDITNANILLVHSSVVKKIGIFYKGFRHGNADYDYSNHAKKAGFPVLLTGNVCGLCEEDHGTTEQYIEKITSMGLLERYKFYSNPLHSSKDYLCFIRRNAFFRYPFVLAGRILNVLFPQFYFKYYKKRH